MFPILARTPFGFIYTFSAIWVLALISSWLWVRERVPGAFGLWLVGVAGGVTGGRLAFVAGNLAYFRENPAESWRLDLGGLGYLGAIAGILLATWLWLRGRGQPLRPVTAELGAIAALLHAAGWAACLLEGCAYGVETRLGWAAADLPDSFGVMAVRYQTQLAGLLLSLVVLGLAGWRRWNLWPVLAVLLAVHAILTLFRGDPAPMLGEWRVDTVAAAAGALLMLAAWWGASRGRTA